MVLALAQKPLHLNTALVSGTYASNPASKLFATLLRVGADWQIKPYLAESWQWSPDNHSLTLRLVNGAVFHDGRPITADDVAFSLQIVKQHHPFRGMLEAVEGVDTKDPRTVVIRLRRTHPALPLVLATPFTPIIPKHVYGDGQDIRTHPANWKPIGSGPFRFVEINSRDEIILERFDRYFIPGRPYVDRLIIKIMDANQISASLEAGYLHAAEMSSTLISPWLERITKSDRLVVDGRMAIAIGPLCWLEFNLRQLPLADVRVRRAMAHVIDREQMLRMMKHPFATLATGPIIADSPFYTPAPLPYPLDEKKANELLDAAGYPRKADGVRFSLTFESGETEFGQEVGELIASVLRRKLGIRVDVRPTSTLKEWAERIANWQYEMTFNNVSYWGDPVIGVHRSYDSHNIRQGVMWANNQGYARPEVDRVLEQAGAEMDPVKRTALYARFRDLVVEDVPILWLIGYRVPVVRSKRLSGIEDTVWGLSTSFDQATLPPAGSK